MDAQLQKSILVGLIAAAIVGLIWWFQSWQHAFAIAVLAFVVASLLSHRFIFRR